MDVNFDSDESFSLPTENDVPEPSSSAIDTNLLSEQQVRKSDRIAARPRPDYQESDSPSITSTDYSPYNPHHIEYIDDDLSGSPARNILHGEVATRQVKKRVIAAAPHGDRCIITHVAGIEVQFCHLLARSTEGEIIRKFEWVAGLLPGELYINSRYNIICLKAEIHILMDNGGFILLPSREVLEALDSLRHWNTNRPGWNDRRQFNKSTEHPALRATSYNYRFIPLPNMPSNRKFSRIELTQNEDGELVEMDPAQWNDYTADFGRYPELQNLRSHAHPFFVCCHAYQQITNLLNNPKTPRTLRDKFRRLEYANEDILFLHDFTAQCFNSEVPAFFNTNSVPEDLLAAKKKNAVLKGLAFPSSPESPDSPFKGKRKPQARSAPAVAKELHILPSLDIATLHCELHASKERFKECLQRANLTVGGIDPRFTFSMVDSLPQIIPKPAARTALPRYREGSVSPSEAARRKKFKYSQADTIRDSASGQLSIELAISTSSEEDLIIASTSAVPLERLPVTKRGGGGRASVAGPSRSQISKGKQTASGSAHREDATASNSAVSLQRLGKRGGRGTTSVAGSYQSKASKGKKKATG
ncbi:hypothetical protein EV361DRAFT_1035431 [Lentinula raphanica]|nr:hypothetical protein EV361DRAFT_1035431 [Lentinula raphanica]